MESPQFYDYGNGLKQPNILDMATTRYLGKVSAHGIHSYQIANAIADFYARQGATYIAEAFRQAAQRIQADPFGHQWQLTSDPKPGHKPPS